MGLNRDLLRRIRLGRSQLSATITFNVGEQIVKG
jgi:hypothetical protein